MAYLAVRSVRKCAAASVDMLSTIFKNDFLTYLIPILKERLFHEQWEVSRRGRLFVATKSSHAASEDVNENEMIAHR